MNFDYTIHEEYQYLNALYQTSQFGIIKPNRTINKTKSIFGNMMKFKLYDENQKKVLPLLTTKNMSKSAEIIFKELEFFIKGQTDNKILQSKNVKIWDANGSREFLDSVGLSHREVGDLGPCFITGTKILTDSGYKNIEDVDIDDKMYTHEGNWQHIVNFQKREYTGELYKIKINHHPFEIISTPEHPFLCNLIKYRNQNQWIEAKYLNKFNNLIGMKFDKEEIIPEIFVIDESFEEVLIKLDKKEEWFMMGYFLGYGYITNNEINKINERTERNEILFNINIKQELNLIIKIQKVLNIQIKNIYKNHKIYNCFNIKWYQILKQFDNVSTEKKIPEWIQKAPKEFILEFINGYCSYFNNSYYFTTVSLNIAYGIQRLYLKLGYFADISFQKRAYQKEEFLRRGLVNQRNCYFIKVYNIPEYLNNYSYIDIKNGIAWFGISSIEKYDAKNENVYNFEVLNDNSYTCENIICHNCYGFQWRHFGAEYNDCHTDYTGKGIDQLQNIIDTIKKDPYNRRLLVTAWNPMQLKEIALPPCHIMFQFNVEPLNDNELPYFLSCIIYQRSCDLPLGAPFNIASYAALTHIIADLTGLKAKELIYFTGDTHIYEDQLHLVPGQIFRKPFPFPNLEFDFGNDKKPINIDQWKAEYLKIINYKFHPLINYPFSV